MNLFRIFFTCSFLLSSLYIFSQEISDSAQVYQYRVEARDFFNQGNYDGVIAAYEKAGVLYQKMEEWGNVGEMGMRKADIYRLQGRYQESLDQIEAIWSSVKDKIEPDNDLFPQRYTATAAIYQDQKLIDLAEENFFRAIEIWKARPDSASVQLAGAYINLGSLYNSKGAYHQAIESHQKGIQMMIDIGMEAHPFLAFGYSNAGNAYQRLGDYQKAILYQQNALNKSAQSLSPIHPFRANVLNSLGVLLRREGNYEKAMEYFLQALEMTTTIFGENHPQVHTILNNRGSLKKEIGDFYGAIEDFQQIRDLGNDQPSENRILAASNIGIVDQAQREYHGATKYFDEALYMAEELYGEQHPKVAEVYLHLGENEFKLGNYSKGIENLKKGFNAVPGVNENEEIPSDPNMLPIFSDLVTKKAEIYAQLAKEDPKYVTDALENYQKAIETVQIIQNQYTFFETKINTRKKSADLFNKAFEIAAIVYAQNPSLENLNAAFQISEQARAALLQASRQEAEARNFAGIPDDLLRIEQRFNTSLLFYQNKLQTETNPDSVARIYWEKQTLRFQRSSDSLKKEMEANYPQYYQLKYQLNVISIEEIQATLPNNNSGLIEYFLTGETGYAFVIGKKEASLIKLNVPENLPKTIYDIRKSIDPDSLRNNPELIIQNYLSRANSLYTSLFGEIKPLLEKSQINQLLIIPHQELHYLPFEMLVENKEGSDFRRLDYLIKTYLISYASSATNWAGNFSAKNGKNWEYEFAGFAPEYNLDFFAQSEELADYETFRDQMTQLTFTQEEVAKATEYFPGITLTSLKATETAFKDVASQARILHLAMHAVVDEENPLQSKLLFAQGSDGQDDGFLNAFELYNLPLDAEMAVLSACNTGYGQLAEGEGVMSLSQAFSFAGCKSVIMSLWPANDKSTSEIMASFYQNLAEGNAKNVSLRQAKLNYLENADPLTAHPYFWVGMVASGNMNAIDTSSPINLWVVLGIAFIVLGGGFLLWRRMN